MKNVTITLDEDVARWARVREPQPLSGSGDRYPSRAELHGRYLLTEDLQDGQDVDGLLIVNPFRLTPADVT